MRLPLLALAGLCLAACQPDSDKTNPAIATDENAAARESQAPAMGANSFTEGQARDRLTQAGYTDVSGLALGDDGVWRGSATLAGQTQTVALDYQGNITAGADPAPSMPSTTQDGTVTDPNLTPQPGATPPATPPEPQP